MLTQATLPVYDALGREVAVLVDGLYGAGSHALELNGAELPEGTYLYRLDAGNTVLTKKMVIVR